MAYRRLLFAGPPTALRIKPGDTPEDIRRKMGGNAGNLLISHSLRQELRFETAMHWHYTGDPAELCEKFDAIVFAASNFLNPSYDFSHVADVLEKVRLPCVMVGLGAQARDETNPRLALQPGTRRFIALVAERCPRIGVRGAFTAEVLASLGIHNVELVGCPSFYASCLPGLSLRQTPPDALRRIALNGSRRVWKAAFDPPRMRAVENALLRDALRFDTAFFAQNGAEEIRLALDPAEVSDAELAPLTDYYSSLPAEQVTAFFRRATRFYGQIEEWRAALAGFDLVIGTRIHGCVLGMLAGVPPLLLVHDTRTQEMARLLAMPHWRIDDPHVLQPAGRWRALLPWRRTVAEGALDIRRLYAQADYAAMAERRRELYGRYKTFLELNQLEHNLA